MTHSPATGRRVLLVFLAAALLAAFGASAISRHEQDGVDAIMAKMEAAESRYREALVKIGNLDPEGRAESDAALEDMEDAVAACTKQRGCEVSGLLVTYERLLKLAADGEGALDQFPGDDVAGHGALFAAGGPGTAGAATLLDDDTHRFDEMVQYNPAVQAGIRRWLTDMRGQLLNTFDNYQYLRPQMWPTYEKAGLPEALLFGIMAKESNGKVHVQSRAGAAGPMQFMYATGMRFGLGQDATGFDTRFDPHASAEASAAYLNERLAELGGSIELSLAAYNGGEGRAKRVYQASGGRGFWDASVYNQFPEETRDYVPMVIAAAWLFLHPEEYGLDIDRVDARPASLVLRKPASIYELTICLGDRGTRDGYMRTLRNLNPRYQADSWLPTGTNLRATTRMARAYERYCVQGPRASLAQRLVQSDPESAIVRGTAPQPQPAQVAKASAPQRYSVQRGETLSSIARKFQCSTQSLARANGIKAPRYDIRPGQALKLEGCRAS
ncbi:MAG: LysM peptidoglycan-binding domain-containing protein [Lysobacteraceae bacterium]|nr:MAG: LysM peptidoglycan-binding domain-containing protein [Xanthomonadaceae bacterium]